MDKYLNKTEKEIDSLVDFDIEIQLDLFGVKKFLKAIRENKIVNWIKLKL